MGNQELTWRKAAKSGNGGNDCVEVATSGRSVHIRDSKRPDAGYLTISPEVFAEFLKRVQ